MTRIVTGQDLIHKTELTYTPDKFWWSERRRVMPGGLLVIFASDTIPDGSVVHEVQIQANPSVEVWAPDIRIWLSIVGDLRPTPAEVVAAQPLIDFNILNLPPYWLSVCSQSNECYPMRRTLHGSNMHFAYEADTIHVGGAEIRVSVLYSKG